MNGSHTVGVENLHYNGHKGEIISLEDFKRLAFPVEELPEEYIVKCVSSEQCTEVINKYYNYDNIWNHWDYIICRQDLFNTNGAPKGNAIEKRIKPEYSEMSVFTFEEWNELINKKEEEMKEFRITGSLALQQAFIKEVGVPYDTVGGDIDEDFDRFNILCNSDEGKLFTSIGTVGTGYKVFNLPTDWDAAVTYVKKWFDAIEEEKEEKIEDLFVPVEAGDLVKICKGESNWSPLMDYYSDNIVRVKTAVTYSSKIQQITFNGGGTWQWELKNKHYRKLSKVELEEFNNKTSVKLGGFTGVIDKERERVDISGRGYLTFENCVELYYKVSSYKIGGYDITFNTTITHVNIGCVENIPVEDIISAVHFMDAAGYITLND